METNTVAPSATTAGADQAPASPGLHGAIELRLEKLERDAGYWRRTAMRLYGASLALGAALVLLFALAAGKASPGSASKPSPGPAGTTQPAATTQDLIRARRLEIVDDKGRVRAQLAVVHGTPGLWLLDEKGKPRASLWVVDGAPGLILSDEKGEPRAGLDVFKGTPGLWLLDEKGKVIWEAPPGK